MSFLETVGAGTYRWASEFGCLDAFTTGFAAISTAEVDQIAVGFGRAFDADRRPAQPKRSLSRFFGDGRGSHPRKPPKGIWAPNTSLDRIR